MPEMIVIAVIALIIFGPRKLPELGKSLGKSIAEFKRASNELKNTLEEEIRTEELQDARKSAQIPPTAATPPATPGPGVAPRPRPRVDAGASATAMRLARLPLAEHTRLFRRATCPTAGSTTTIRRRRQDVVSGAPRRAPEADHPRADLPLPRRRDRRLFHRRDLCVRDAAPAADAPAGRDDDLHLPDRSVHAVHPHRGHRGAVHRGAADLLAGMAVRRAGALRRKSAATRFPSSCCRASASSAARPSRTTSRSR